MEMSDVLNLITESFDTDKYGNEVATETQTEVFCEVNSITQNEFFAAGKEGFRPSFRFDVFFGDYNDEQILEYDGKRYFIYRTYRRDDTMELYTEMRVGV